MSELKKIIIINKIKKLKKIVFHRMETQQMGLICFLLVCGVNRFQRVLKGKPMTLIKKFRKAVIAS